MVPVYDVEMNNPFDYVPDSECVAAYSKLLGYLQGLQMSCKHEDIRFMSELEAGKMLGVLIAEDESGNRHPLYAFSGQIGDGGFYFPGFVEPVFDYLAPDGYFKTCEADISRLSEEIRSYEEQSLAKIKAEYERVAESQRAVVILYKNQCRESKLAREAKRACGEADESALAAMIRQSQYEKAELHRLKKRMSETLEPYILRLREAEQHLHTMRDERRARSEALQQWLFTHFTVLNARGESRSLKDIFAGTAYGIPPSGSGECCAPKLLQAAYRRGWRPLSMAEYWYGRPKGGEVRRHGEYYPACRGKCLPVLSWMLEGVEVDGELDHDVLSNERYEPRIIFQNQWFCVVDKPSGMLSVPGKVEGVSVQEWLMKRLDAGPDVKMAHRLDRDTSGLIIATFSEDAYKQMQRLFATRRVHKTYEAVLEGDYHANAISPKGMIELPLSADIEDRPRQRVDRVGGKIAVTEYEFMEVKHGRSRIQFHPLTGRTHQLRVHAASADGLGMPIVGDPLYGIHTGGRLQRLHLHASEISFMFPLDEKEYIFQSPVPF